MMGAPDPEGERATRPSHEHVVADAANGRPTVLPAESAMTRFAGAEERFVVSALLSMPEAQRTPAMEKRLSFAFWGMEADHMERLADRARADERLPDDLAALGIDTNALLARRSLVQNVFTPKDRTTLLRGGVLMVSVALSVLWSIWVGFMSVAWGTLLLGIILAILGGFLWQFRRARRAGR